MKRFALLFSALGLLLTALSATAKIADNIARTKVGAIDVITLTTGVKDVVTLRGMLPVGNAAAPESNPALARLTGSMLDKGTTTHDKFAIAQQLESVGAALNFGVGNETLAISGKCLKKDVPLLISLIAEQLRSPAFSPEEFAKVKKQYIGALKRAADDTDDRAADAFSRAVYPLGHPNRQPDNAELIAAVERTTLDEVKAFHAAYYGPAYLTLVLIGDVDTASVRTDVGQSFTGWTGGQRPVPPAAKGGDLDVPHDQTVFMSDKTNVSVVWGMATGLRYSDPDALALRVGTNVLGGGFIARLMGNVRDKEGLTYGIYAFVSNDNLRDGDMRIWANFAPELLEKGVASTKRQLDHWYQDGITATELAQRKSDTIGAFKVSLSTTDGMAGAILSALQRGYDVTWLDEYPEKIQALTLADVNGAIKKHLDPAKMILVKAGTVAEPTK
ncbi:MAG: insulinase family protein [Opitutaceae bacterium]|nr:insulinase family protein [Opitutaceae bacterium]MBP9912755.1 insulinase family protein [Opitutaceae bacterium]